jgi:putative transposase
MRRSRFSEQQIAFFLRQAEEGTAVEEVCRKAGILIRSPETGSRDVRVFR